MDKEELLWRQYQLHIDLYRGYLDLVLKFNLFFYAVTGAILSFYFVHRMDPLIKYSLLLQLAMSIVFAFFFGYCALIMRHARDEIFSIRDSLGLSVAPETKVLIIVLRIFTVLLTVVSIYLILLFIG